MVVAFELDDAGLEGVDPILLVANQHLQLSLLLRNFEFLTVGHALVIVICPLLLHDGEVRWTLRDHQRT